MLGRDDNSVDTNWNASSIIEMVFAGYLNEQYKQFVTTDERVFVANHRPNNVKCELSNWVNSNEKLLGISYPGEPTTKYHCGEVRQVSDSACEQEQP